METVEPRELSENWGKLTRRQLLKGIPALAAGGALSAAALSACSDPVPPPPTVAPAIPGPSVTPRDTLPTQPLLTREPVTATPPASTREPATPTQASPTREPTPTPKKEENAPAPPTAEKPLASDIPPRTPKDALESCLARRQQEERRMTSMLSPLVQLLGRTPLSESRIGLNHWLLMDEPEDLDLGHFRFAISPYTAFVDDGKQRHLLFGNFPLIGSFRGMDYLEDVQRHMFDRGVWAMANGCQGTAVVELDRPLSPQKVGRIVRALYDYGVRTITWGNELNDPGAGWRDNPAELVKVFSAAAETRRQYHLDDLELSLPGMAYFGHGEYLRNILGIFRSLLPGWSDGSIRHLPFQRAVDHYYGPVDGFLRRLGLMRETMASVGLNDLKFDLAEVGNPTLHEGQQHTTDEHIAEGYIPQITSLAIASGMMDRLHYYSLLDRDDGYSLVRIEGGRLAKKRSYFAFATMARLLSRLSTLSWSETGETMRVDGSRTDGIDFTVLWSMATGRDMVVPLPPGRRAFDALGSEVRGPEPGQVVLRPRGHPSLGGAAVILVSRR